MVCGIPSARLPASYRAAETAVASVCLIAVLYNYEQCGYIPHLPCHAVDPLAERSLLHVKPAAG